MKRARLIGGEILILLILAGASFYAGILHQRSIGTASGSGFPPSAGLSAGPGGAGGPVGTPGAAFGGSAQGQIESIDGNTITIRSGQNSSTVTLSSSTVISKPVSGVSTDIKIGDRVQVTGQTDSNGNIAASQIMVIAPVGNAGQAVNASSAP